METLDKLKEKNLPPCQAFYSTLIQSGITEEEYKRCEGVWLAEDMQTFGDFLVWYNNLDVAPFLQALKKRSSVFAEKGIDMFKRAISLPRLATSWLFAVEGRSAKEHKPIALIDRSCADSTD